MGNFDVNFNAFVGPLIQEKLDDKKVISGMGFGVSFDNRSNGFSAEANANTSFASTTAAVGVKQCLVANENFELKAAASAGVILDNMNTVEPAYSDNEQIPVHVHRNPQAFGRIGVEASVYPTRRSEVTVGAYGTYATNFDEHNYTVGNTTITVDGQSGYYGEVGGKVSVPFFGFPWNVTASGMYNVTKGSMSSVMAGLEFSF